MKRLDLNPTLPEWFDSWEAKINERLRIIPAPYKTEYEKLKLCLDRVRRAAVNNDIERTILETEQFTCRAKALFEDGRESLRRIKNAKSAQTRQAANERHKLPLPTVKALKDEYAATQKELGQDAKPTTIYKAMAKRILKHEKYWRRIRTNTEKSITE